MSDIIFLKSKHGKIKLDEWNGLVERDSSLSLVEEKSCVNPRTKQKLVIQIPGFAVYKCDGQEIEIYYNESEGVLYAKNNADISSKFFELSKELDASICYDLDDCIL